MGLKDFNKLTKLTIEPEEGETGNTFEVMFNPETYSEAFSLVYTTKNAANSGIEEYVYVKSLPQDFKLKFIIDGTGVSSYNAPFLPVYKDLDKSVYDKVNQFLRLAWYPEKGKPTPLVIKWNRFTYHCMLKDVTINYTLFSREGLPLRAELDVSFIGNTEKNVEYYKSRLYPDSNDNTKAPNVQTSPPNSQTSSINNQTSSSGQNGIIISVS
jgi:hypothetical protein